MIRINKSYLELLQGDITQVATDAIVNAANSSLMGGGGVDGAIHKAGGPAILEECKKIIEKIGKLPTGEAVITTGGNLRAKYVIHTVGPIWRGGKNNEENLLKNAYLNSLKLADSHNLSSVAFPSISTGVYRFPIKEASQIALETIMNFLQQDTSVEKVIMVLFGSNNHKIYNETLNKILEKRR